MWGFLIGLYLAMAIYPFVEDWRQHRANSAALKRMRLNHANGRRWDAAKGQWEMTEMTNLALSRSSTNMEGAASLPLGTNPAVGTYIAGAGGVS